MQVALCFHGNRARHGSSNSLRISTQSVSAAAVVG